MTREDAEKITEHLMAIKEIALRQGTVDMRVISKSTQALSRALELQASTEENLLRMFSLIIQRDVETF